MTSVTTAGKRLFTDDEWKQIREGWAEIHNDTAKTLRKVGKDYKPGSKMRKRLDAVMKREEQVFDFDLRVLEALQEMDSILHPATPVSETDGRT